MSDIKEALKKLSEKRDVISERAIKAKESYDQNVQTADADEDMDYKDDLSELKENMALLTQLFKTSKFDEIVYFLANPTQLLTINFFIGILRGMGFAIGFLVIAFICIYLVISGAFPNLLSLLN